MEISSISLITGFPFFTHAKPSDVKVVTSRQNGKTPNAMYPFDGRNFMLRKLLRLAALPVVGTALMLGATQAANAAVHPNNVINVGSPLGDNDGTAGLYTQKLATTFTHNQADFVLPKAGTPLLFSVQGGYGVTLCNSEDGATVGTGEVASSATTYAVGYFYGTQKGDALGNGDSCNGGTFLATDLGGGGGFVSLFTVPAGDTITDRVDVVTNEFGTTGPAGVWFRAQDSSNPVLNDQVFVSFATMNDSENFSGGPFNEAAAGVSGNFDFLSGPATNDIADISNMRVTGNGLTHGYAWWNAVEVASSADAQAPWLITPSNVTPSAVTSTTVPGHRVYSGPKGHRTWVWVKAKTTYQGYGPTSMSLMAGQKVGL